jgi:hypothetical protein
MQIDGVPVEALMPEVKRRRVSDSPQRRRAVYRRRRLGVLLIAIVPVVAVVALLHAGRAGTRGAPRTSASKPPPLSSPALSIAETLPSAAYTVAAGSRAFAVRFSEPIALSSPTPTVSPPLAGRWVHVDADTMAFLADQPLASGQVVTVSVAGGSKGVESTSGTRLARTAEERFEVSDPWFGRAEVALSRLSYLPFRPLNAVSEPLGSDGGSVITVQSGPGFVWSWKTVPAALASLWAPGRSNAMADGAISAFEHDHGLASTASRTSVMAALTSAVTTGETSSHPYSYVLVRQTLPQTLSLWQGGDLVLTSLANTGEAGAATPIGTWPVYERYQSQTMHGTDAAGTPYTYPDVPWVSYFTGSIAVHAFTRSTYGYPQSAGCVELPPAAAATVWHALWYGSLVTVQAPSAPTFSQPAMVRPS